MSTPHLLHQYFNTSSPALAMHGTPLPPACATPLQLLLHQVAVDADVRRVPGLQHGDTQLVRAVSPGDSATLGSLRLLLRTGEWTHTALPSRTR